MRTPLFFLFFTLAACPYIPEGKYNTEVRDADRDGVAGDRFGGDDCRDNDPSITDCDADEDGFLAVAAGGDDCDDNDKNVHPDALERCNEIDDDCDNLIDDEDDIVDGAPIWYADDDGDGYGDAEEGFQQCTAPPNTVEDDRDCNDADSEIKPGATEFCSDVDSNCDGDPYSGAVDPSDWYDDQDQDGYGAGPVVATACAGLSPAGTVEDNTDCDDSAASAYPGAAEIWYDDIDQDCLGGSDHDQDGDGYDILGVGPDCDDGNANVSPDAEEICDSGVDNDCSGDADNEDTGVRAADLWTYFHDNDGDSFGDDSTAALFCPNTQPANYVSQGGDCDDEVPSVSPVGVEVCDGDDNDCDGFVDNGALGRVEYFLDNDGDGYGDAPILACEEQLGYASVDGDCNDADAQTYPGAPELCGDNFRQDCTALSPDDCDSDGHEDEAVGGDDCDDSNPTVYPNANEVCDGADNDCNGLIDSADPDVDLSTVEDFYLDADGDGYGGVILVAPQACAPIAGAAANDDDCDDDDPFTYPGALELCDGVDNTCEGDIDEGPIADPIQYYLDSDGDGSGNPNIVSALGCDPPADGNTWVTDNADCHDGEPAVHPLADEICDSLDNDCDDLIDEDDPSASLPTWYLDDDQDGYGQTFDTLSQCSQPPGYSPVPGDCNDFEPTANPGATEICDGGIDNDCDGLGDDADPDLTTNNSWYPDADADGYGDAVGAIVQCEQPVGHVNNDLDCDDSNPTVSPASSEVCDGGIDNDCDGNADDADDDTVNQPSWFEDADADGWGSTAVSTQACSLPAGYLPQSGDCDDTRSDINPSAAEICDGDDNDCDALIDDADDDTLLTIWHNDSDGDGYGSPTDVLTQCNYPGIPYGVDSQDCDDNDVSIHPMGTEICDFKDNNCDGLTDDADPTVSDPMPWYQDADGDGYGDSQDPGTLACVGPPGTSSNNLDCLDSSSRVNPSIPVEFCNGLDDDCDGLIDDADDPVVDANTYFDDNDGDGYGDESTRQDACSQPSGAVQIGMDCDDTNSQVNPSAMEVCNGLDDDCNGLQDDSDPGLTGAPIWYADLDNDGFGDVSRFEYACNTPNGYVIDDSDCDDFSPHVNPAAPEMCNAVDDNCDSQIDDADPLIIGVPTWYTDSDGDTFGDPNVFVSQCLQPPDTVTNDYDCDDTESGVHPFATEICDNMVDNDCDGQADDNDSLVVGAPNWYADGDGDGFGDTSNTWAACSQPLNYLADDSDCDDTNVMTNPLATETCDGTDNDCDGLIDDADPNLVGTLYYFDGDGDGFGRADLHVMACAAPSNWVGGNALDCDDQNPAVNDLALEVCDGIDNDCDGAIDDNDGNVTGQPTWYKDSDLDGYGSPSVDSVQCTQPADTAAEPNDCDDTNSSIHPQAVEVCDFVDNDCDTLVDDNDPAVVGNTYYADNDGDGYGDPLSPSVSCSPMGAVSDYTDCDDNDGLLYPGQILTVGNAGADFGTITGAMSAACDDGTIQVYPGTWNEALDFAGRVLAVEGIDPNNPPVLASPTTPAITISATPRAGTRVANMIISTGLTAPTNGGGATVTAATVTFDGVVFWDNHASLSGGGLYITNNSDVTITNSVFLENTATTGGGIAATSSEVLIIDTAITDNTGFNSAGGVYSADSGSLLTVLGGSFSYNTASYGAAIETNNQGALHIIGGDYSYNDASSALSINGDAILDSLTVRHSTLHGIVISTLFTPTTADITNAHLYGNAQAGLYTTPSSNLTINVTSSGAWSNAVGFHLRSSDTSLTNITAFGNDTGVIVEDSSCAINNAILYGNSVTNLDGTGVFTGPVTYSMFQTAGELTSWPSPTNVSGDPMILTYQANLSPDLWDVHVAPGGTPLGIGDPAILNSNGTRSDIGRHGGPAGDADWYDDDDSDFLADGWERNFFGPNTSLFDAFDDPDGDGVDNTGELLSGTHPLNSDTDGDSWSDDIDNAPLNPQSH